LYLVYPSVCVWTQWTLHCYRTASQIVCTNTLKHCYLCKRNITHDLTC
jgi:hypothetical protein